MLFKTECKTVGFALRFLFCGSQYAFVKEGSLPTGNVFVWLAFLKGLDSFFFDTLYMA